MYAERRCAIAKVALGFLTIDTKVITNGGSRVTDLYVLNNREKANMRRLKAIAIFVIGIFSVVFVNPAVNAQNEVVMFDCLQSFEYFAYAIQEDLTETDKLDITWVPQYQLPITNDSGQIISYRGTRVLLSRTVRDNQEIWLQLNGVSNSYEDPAFGIYHVSDNTLTLVSGRVGNSEDVTKVNELTVGLNGTIWASTDQFIFENIIVLPGMDNPFPASYASVATYVETNNRFVSVSESPQIPFRTDAREWDPLTQIVVDSNGILWVFLVRGEVYQFDPTTNTFPLSEEFSDMVFQSVSPTFRSSIFIDILPEVGSPSPFPSSLPVSDTFFEFFPGTGEILDIPASPILLRTGLPVLIDRNNRAWFSAMAYLENEQWTVVNPDPNQTQAVLSQIQFPTIWTFPTPILSDSSGRMWFETVGDNSFGTHGTAWFDPETGNGCKFSNSTGNVIEDNNGFLWLFDPITGTLYRSAESNSSTVIHP